MPEYILWSTVNIQAAQTHEMWARELNEGPKAITWATVLELLAEARWLQPLLDKGVTTC